VVGAGAGGWESTAEGAAFLDLQASWMAGLRSRVLSRVPVRSARSVVEAGCGTGSVLSTLAAVAANPVTGIDRDEACLETAGRACPPGTVLMQGDLEAMRLPGADLFVFSHVLLHISDLGRFLTRVRRALRGGGYAAVLCEYDWTAASGGPGPGLIAELVTALRASGIIARSSEEMLDLFRRAGFRTIASGVERGIPAAPGEAFLASLGIAPDAGPVRPGTGAVLSLPVFWGVFRKD